MFQKYIQLEDLKDFGFTPNDTQNNYLDNSIIIASTRINTISGGRINQIGFDNLIPSQIENVKKATCYLVKYVLEGNLNWIRGSVSVNQGQESVSQVFADTPDYIMRDVYDLLQQASLYTPLTGLYEDKKCNDDNFPLDGVYLQGGDRNFITWMSANQTFLKPNKVVSPNKTINITIQKTGLQEPILELDISNNFNLWSSDDSTVYLNIPKNINLQSKNIINLADGINPNDGVNKKQLDVVNEKVLVNENNIDGIISTINATNIYEETYENGIVIEIAESGKKIRASVVNRDWNKPTDGTKLDIDVISNPNSIEPQISEYISTKVNGFIQETLTNVSGNRENVKISSTWTINSTNLQNWDIVIEAEAQNNNFFTRTDLKIVKIFATGISVDVKGYMKDDGTNFKNANIPAWSILIKDGLQDGFYFIAPPTNIGDILILDSFTPQDEPVYKWVPRAKPLYTNSDFTFVSQEGKWKGTNIVLTPNKQYRISYVSNRQTPIQNTISTFEDIGAAYQSYSEILIINVNNNEMDISVNSQSSFGNLSANDTFTIYEIN